MPARALIVGPPSRPRTRTNIDRRKDVHVGSSKSVLPPLHVVVDRLALIKGVTIALKCRAIDGQIETAGVWPNEAEALLRRKRLYDPCAQISSYQTYPAGGIILKYSAVVVREDC